MSRISYNDLGNKYGNAWLRANKSNYEVHEPIYFYHISPTPISPENEFFMAPDHIQAGEDELFGIRRICVAPTIEQCLVAVAPYNPPTKMYVYRTCSVVKKSVIPYGVYDAPITQERWVTRKRKFKLVGELPMGYNDTYGMSELLSERFESGCAYPYRVRMNFDDRGSPTSLYRQQCELRRIRKFMRQHDTKMFINDIEKSIHDKQRNMKLRLNRNDPNRLRTSSSG